ncbi:membrane protein, putative [Pseudooceanicola batsensis HTCC2597]|uniref:Membrane protein, putative n=1 Tax=Pseudooceanicola batsensis (strain ATCC BAA-863 / DSM 15984 / KCTC 12145 / HTCC2597) TaxID=252305 RepID=A3U1Y2_PSEBH|nr:DMT family transporter [Pseudooceanicola batsensis]EAQ01916.1 membrane protein, putative [Pseudooceanicola batsensis HTCC2597]
MESWIFFALAATVFQTARFMLQKVLSTGGLSAGGATFARFLYSGPLVWAAALILLPDWPDLGRSFWPYAIAGGLAQILATVCVVLLFQTRNFAVGITLKKTEVLLTVLVGLVILGEGVSWAAFAAMVVGVLGVLLLSDPPRVGRGGIREVLFSRGVVLGLTSGVFFGISAVAYRGATLEVAADPATRALVTLAAVLAVQILSLGAWLLLREPGEVPRVARAWRRAVWIGLTSLGGSFCWFTAFTLQNAGYVFAVGQVEVILSLLASVYFFRERITGKEVIGIALITLSVIVLIAMA